MSGTAQPGDSSGVQHRGAFGLQSGVVELTVAIHRVYDTSRDRLVFDVGHQCYVHKMLTGRNGRMETLRSFGGIAGFPKPAESQHDACIAGHASAAVSTALGMAIARTRLGEDYWVVALLGDGSLTGGLAYEGLSMAGQSGEPMVVILNDNGMSINASMGGIAQHLAKQRLKPQYLWAKEIYRKIMRATPPGRVIHQGIHKIKEAIKASLLPCSMFENMGFQYMGPVDGHDVKGLTRLLRYAASVDGPVLLHVKTVKGKGFPPAEKCPDEFHGIGPKNQAAPANGRKEETFSQRFGRDLVHLAQEDSRICAITAAMTDGTYTGEGKGRNGTITVEVTVKAGKLDAVKVVKHTETVGISDAAVADFPKAIVAAQSTAVDAVAGATMTSEGIRAAVAQAIQKAGGDPAQFATAVVKKKAAKKLVKENADIVVVGAGGSGISAAVKAETLGANVILIEKMPVIGGATALNAGTLIATGSKYQREVMKETKDSPELAYKDIFTVGKNRNDPTLVKMVTERVGGVVDWLIYDMKIPYGPAATQYPDHSANRQLGVTGRSVNYLNLMREKFLGMGGKLMLQTRAQELIRDDAGKVVGVRATDKDGNKVGKPFKSSVFGKEAGIAALEKRMLSSAAWVKSHKDIATDTAARIASAMQTAGRDRVLFERELMRQGIGVVFRTNDAGRIYGTTFIDHADKTVFNGSRLGKEFSAGVFNELFAGQDTATGVASQQHQPEHSHTSDWQEQRTDYRPDHKDGTTRNVAAAFNLFAPVPGGASGDHPVPPQRKKRKSASTAGNNSFLIYSQLKFISICKTKTICVDSPKSWSSCVLSVFYL